MYDLQNKQMSEKFLAKALDMFQANLYQDMCSFED